GTKPGTTCGSNRGCYGLPPLFSSSTPTQFFCAGDVNPTRVHRSACDGTQHTGDGYPCELSGSIYPNSCAQGYQPLLTDADASPQEDCIAMCKATDCYAGHCTNGAIGLAPHQCATADIKVDPAVAFDALGSAHPDGEQCNFIWNLEFDA